MERAGFILHSLGELIQKFFCLLGCLVNNDAAVYNVHEPQRNLAIFLPQPATKGDQPDHHHVRLA